MRIALCFCHSAAAILSLLGSLTPARAETTFDAPGNFNPIVPGYFADPTIEQFGDTFYLYATTDGKVDGPGHHSFLKRGDDYFIVYHRHDIPVTPNGMHRQTCAHRLVFERDGVIKKVQPTHAGIGYLAPKARSANLAFGKKVTASSFYRDTLRHHAYKPEYAVDDNNATLWRPADNGPGHWLTVDLGSPQRVRRTEAQFEYGTWFYQYLIESSVDGQSWKTFADRCQNTRWGSPMVDDGNTEARYLRITMTGTEYPGLFGALWNFKAYADAPADPLLVMADKAFAEFVASKPRGNRGGEAQTSAARQSLLASLRVYGGALSEVEVKKLVADESSADVLVHLDAAKLDYGPLKSWANNGSLGSGFSTGDKAPKAEDLNGRIAVRFEPGQSLALAPGADLPLTDFTLLASVANPTLEAGECVVEVESADGSRSELLTASPAASWPLPRQLRRRQQLHHVQ